MRLLQTLTYIVMVVSPVVSAQSLDSVRKLFEGLAAGGAPLSPAEMEKSIRPIETAPAVEVRETLKLVRPIAVHADANVRLHAATAILDVALVRADGAELLTPYLDIMIQFLNDSDSRFANIGQMALAAMKPKPPSQVIPPLLAFAGREDRTIEFRMRVLAVAVVVDPENDQVAAAVERAVASNLEVVPLTRLLDAFGIARGNRFIKNLTAALQDPRPAIRAYALQKFQLRGSSAVRANIVEIERVRTADSDPAVRQQAEQVLRTLGGSALDK